MKYLLKIIGGLILASTLVQVYVQIIDFTLILKLFAGITLLFSSEKHFKHLILIKKQGSVFFTTFILETVFFSCLYVLSLLLKKVLLLVQNKFIENAVIDQTQLIDPIIAAQMLSVGKSFLVQYSITILMYLALVLVLYSSTRSLIWAFIAKKEFTKKTLLQFLRLDALWFLLWIVLFLFFAFGTKPELAVFGFYFIMIWSIHSTLFAHITLIKSNKALYSFSQGLKQSFTKLKLALPYYGVAIAIAWIIFLLINLTPVPQTIIYQLETIIFIAFFSWYRIYTSNSILHSPHN
ncbi:hypothetical protein HYV79_04805 [Candidatus Woesearchaeota archaeon]|nr:hypothetical protein [Candidatus Woesearchaeota archaeon]